MSYSFVVVVAVVVCLFVCLIPGQFDILYIIDDTRTYKKLQCTTIQTEGWHWILSSSSKVKQPFTTLLANNYVRTTVNYSTKYLTGGRLIY